MIAHLCGLPVMTGDRWVVIDVNGIGYHVQVTYPALQVLSRTQGQVKLFTYMAIREDAVTLYGFLKPSELEMFRILIGVTGIGPQIALNILSKITIDDFAIAILNNDEKALTRISGIGPKSAKRLILELRDKMKKVGDAMITGGRKPGGSAARDAVSALVSLGFNEQVAVDVVNAAVTGTTDASVQVLIKTALAKLRDF
ncbi:MAG: Holliday junction branch migration protein RuvA [Methanoregula sp.]|nr:Holliday junction branch migration protein RuvA [Methanoregula sp.]